MKKPVAMKPIGMSMPREHTSSTKAPSFAEKAPVAPKAPKMPTAPVAVAAPKQMGATTVAAPKAPKVSSRMKQINGM